MLPATLRPPSAGGGATSSGLYLCLIEILQALFCARVRYPRTWEPGVRWYLGVSLTEKGAWWLADTPLLVTNAHTMTSMYPRRPGLTAAQRFWS